MKRVSEFSVTLMDRKDLCQFLDTHLKIPPVLLFNTQFKLFQLIFLGSPVYKAVF